MIKKLQGVTKAIKGLKTAVGGKKTRARNKKSTAELRNKATKDAFKKANSSRPDLESKAKRKKKMDAERPLSARRDMAKKDTFTGQKYRTGGPEGGMRQMTPEYKAFLKKQAKKQDKRDTLIALGAAGATGAGATAAMVSAGKKEAERVKKEQERIKKFQDEKLKSKKKVPVKKAKGGMVTKWESKWG